MTPDLNPLNELVTHSVYHILIGFQYSEDAYNFDLDKDIGPTGTEFKSGCGSALVFANESKGTECVIKSAQTVWSFFSDISHRTSSYDGKMEFVDRSGFFFTGNVQSFLNRLDMSLNHLTFMWVPVFYGTKDSRRGATVVKPKPMFFHVAKFTQNTSPLSGRLYYFDIVSCYNSHGLSPQFSIIQQNTVSSAESNAINSKPKPIEASSGIKSTRKEDAQKLKARESRLQKVKYMKTIADFCAGFSASLNDQKNQHKRQLQQFMSLIRDDYSDKILDIKKEQPLPIDYTIKVSDYYKSKTIDNRNLPFEQYEIDQSTPGISSITFPPSSSIQAAISLVMKMSNEIGIDHTKKPTRTYKITTVTSRKCDGNYLIHTNVNDYISPYNGEPSVKGFLGKVIPSVNTGPGEGAVDKPIEYTYQDKNGMLSSDTTITSITYSTSPVFAISTSEVVNDDVDSQSVYGDREVVSANRGASGSEFFRDAFSGLRTVRGLMTDNGLQNPIAAAAISNFSPTQQTTYTIRVLGNPHLLSDLNRNPNDVIAGKEGSPIIYKFVEYEPMYMKLKIYISNAEMKKKKKISAFYYDGYLHMHRIVSEFNAGSFMQTIYCSRTNENV